MHPSTPLLTDLHRIFGLSPTEITPISGGWLNRKWKLRCAEGDFLLKEFSRERYSDKKLARIEAALKRQTALQADGIPCPRILDANGCPMRYMADGTVYMVMDFCAGHTPSPHTVTPQQMESLGEVTARMHESFAKLPTEGVRWDPPSSAALLSTLQKHHSASLAVTSNADPLYARAVRRQKDCLRTLSEAYLDSIPRGIAHEDFTPDNMLLDAGGVTAILDFDRCCYSYPLHDVGRILLSLALRDGMLSPAALSAFRIGYTRHRPLSGSDLADALRITWCIETPWWITQSQVEEQNAKISRFRDEIVWVGEHWDTLDTLLS